MKPKYNPTTIYVVYALYVIFLLCYVIYRLLKKHEGDNIKKSVAGIITKLVDWAKTASTPPTSPADTSAS